MVCKRDTSSDWRLWPWSTPTIGVGVGAGVGVLFAFTSTRLGSVESGVSGNI